jgi:hypothetical protein
MVFLSRRLSMCSRDDGLVLSKAYGVGTGGVSLSSLLWSCDEVYDE